MDDPTGGKLCEYTISGQDQMISAGGDVGKCPSTVSKTDFNPLKFGNGINTAKIPDTDCEYTISKVLKGYGVGAGPTFADNDLGNDNICTIKVGCGLQAELVVVFVAHLICSCMAAQLTTLPGIPMHLMRLIMYHAFLSLAALVLPLELIEKLSCI